ncbi:MAG: hypothetical protein O3C40_26575, partial [Planctomycetota bacterium]|nr:hypothetical protein [Planctomycetota bacterium]
NANGQFTSIARYNDTDGTSGDEIATSSYTYDTLGRLTDLAYKNGGTNLFTPYQWSYDNLHRVTQFVSADGTAEYTYDKTSQLTAADHTLQTDETYTYDANGNRTMTGYTTGSNNQLLNDGTYSYTYDDEGNRTKRTNVATGAVTEYAWDFRNRLTKVTEKDSLGATTKVVEYTYDVFDRRIAKAVDITSPFNLADAAIERYVYDELWSGHSVTGNGPDPFALDTSNSNVVLDFLDPDGTGSSPSTLNSRQLYGNAVDQILAQEDVDETITSADRVLWPLADHLGTVRDLAKNDGTLGPHYKYNSFGQITSGDTSRTRYLFTSREYDSATGLQYNRARWYDTEVGRWISEDPMGLAAGDSNLARYVHNSASNSTDPSGFQEVGPPWDPYFLSFLPPPAPPHVTKITSLPANTWYMNNIGSPSGPGLFSSTWTTPYATFHQGCQGLCTLLAGTTGVGGTFTLPHTNSVATPFFGPNALMNAISHLNMLQQQPGNNPMLFVLQLPATQPPSAFQSGNVLLDQLALTPDKNFMTLITPNGSDPATWYWLGMNHGLSTPGATVFQMPFSNAPVSQNAPPTSSLHFNFTVYVTLPTQSPIYGPTALFGAQPISTPSIPQTNAPIIYPIPGPLQMPPTP